MSLFDVILSLTLLHGGVVQTSVPRFTVHGKVFTSEGSEVDARESAPVIASHAAASHQPQGTPPTRGGGDGARRHR